MHSMVASALVSGAMIFSVTPPAAVAAQSDSSESGGDAVSVVQRGATRADAGITPR